MSEENGNREVNEEELGDVAGGAVYSSTRACPKCGGTMYRTGALHMLFVCSKCGFKVGDSAGD